MSHIADHEATGPAMAARGLSLGPDEYPEPGAVPVEEEVAGWDSLARVFAGNQIGRFVFLLPLMGLGVVLLLRDLGTISRMPLWTYLVAAGFCVLVALLIKPWAVSLPPGWELYTQIAAIALGADSFIYLTGWGPAMLVAFVFVGAMSVIRHGSAAWKASLAINGAAIALGQLAIGLGWAPSKLGVAQAQTIAVMGLVAFGLMVGLTSMVMKQIEGRNAEIERTSAEIERTSAEIERTSKELQKSEDKFRSLLAHSSDTTMVIDPAGTEILYASPATFDLLGIKPEDFDGLGPGSFIHPDDVRRVYEEIYNGFFSGNLVRTEFSVKKADGTIRHVEGVASDLREDEAVGGVVLNLHDITHRKLLEESLSHDVLHDGLTGLPNRRLLRERLEMAMARNRRVGPGPPEPVVLFVDLDKFKAVNDDMGHASGDDLLIQVGQRMQACLRETDTLARFGGDEFVVLGENFADIEAAKEFARRLVACVDEPFDLGGKMVAVGMSVGIAIAHHTMTAEQVLDYADQAMYVAKGNHDSHLATSGMDHCDPKIFVDADRSVGFIPAP